MASGRPDPFVPRPVVLVHTPGWPSDAYDDLTTRLQHRGHAVQRVEAACAPASIQAFQDAIQRARRAHPDAAVIAHGLAAPFALASGPGRFVLLAPALAPPWGALGDALLHLDDVDDLAAWPALHTLHGEHGPRSGCLPTGYPAALAHHLRAPPHPDSGSHWVAVGLLDELAPLEVVIPAVRQLPHRTLLRAGVLHLDGADHDHAAMLRDPGVLRAAARAAGAP